VFSSNVQLPQESNHLKLRKKVEWFILQFSGFIKRMFQTYLAGIYTDMAQRRKISLVF